MRVALTFRLYMMRYGVAVLATSYTHHGRSSFAEDVAKEVKAFLTRKTEVPNEHVGAFREYLLKKPGSPRYSPWRRAFQNGQSVPVEHQDLLLSDQRLPSSVGALTQDYFDDALGLAHTLKLVDKRQNLLLARGRLSLSTGWVKDDPFVIGDRDALFLGLWLLDVDCDWVWAFLSQLPDDLDFEISVGNRVQLLLESWRYLLTARGVRPDQATAMVRTRLNELLKITERNVRDKLNLGQPWSWFLVPRLELLVDAGILSKRERHGLSGYALTAVGQRMRSLCLASEDGGALIAHYFSCHDSQNRQIADEIKWEAIRERLEAETGTLATSVGYMPIFETASALCVAQFTERTDTSTPLWEIEGVRASLLVESKAPESKVRLGIDRQGHVYAFRIKDE
ncbi:MAG: hypothetical protein OXP11_11040 [Gammaproteobacteria bacterium]|nr:hypothetical protein [Gammaproteobacteria bacterium]